MRCNAASLGDYSSRVIVVPRPFQKKKLRLVKSFVAVKHPSTEDDKLPFDPTPIDHVSYIVFRHIFF